MRPILTFSVSQLQGMPPDAQIRALGQMTEQLVRATNLIGLTDADNGTKVGNLDAVWLTVQMGAAGQDVTFPHNLKAVPSGVLVAQTALDAGELSQPCAIEVMSATDKTITLRATGTNRVLSVVTSPVTLANSVSAKTMASVKLPADLLHAGDTLQYAWRNSYGTTGTPTLTAVVGWDTGTNPTQSVAVTTVNNASGEPHIMDGVFTIEDDSALGASRHEAIFQGAGTLAAQKMNRTTNLPVNAQRTLSFSLQWGTANAANTITQDSFTLELISASTPTTRLILF